jgi:hypothetical protein
MEGVVPLKILYGLIVTDFNQRLSGETEMWKVKEIFVGGRVINMSMKSRPTSLTDLQSAPLVIV